MATNTATNPFGRWYAPARDQSDLDNCLNKFRPQLVKDLLKSTTYHRLSRAKDQAHYNRNVVELGAHLTGNPALQISESFITRFADLLCTDDDFFSIARDIFPALRNVNLPASQQPDNPHIRRLIRNINDMRPSTGPIVHRQDEFVRGVQMHVVNRFQEVFALVGEATGRREAITRLGEAAANIVLGEDIEVEQVITQANQTLVTGLEAHVLHLTEQNRSLRTELQSVRSGSALASAPEQANSEQIGQLRGELSAAQFAANVLRGQVKDAEERAGQAEQQLATITSNPWELLDLRERVKELEKRAETAEKQLRTAGTAGTTTSEGGDFTQQLDNIANFISKRDTSELAELEEQLRSMTSERDVVEGRLKEAQTKLTHLGGQLEYLKEQREVSQSLQDLLPHLRNAATGIEALFPPQSPVTQRIGRDQSRGIETRTSQTARPGSTGGHGHGPSVEEFLNKTPPKNFLKRTAAMLTPPDAISKLLKRATSHPSMQQAVATHGSSSAVLGKGSATAFGPVVDLTGYRGLQVLTDFGSFPEFLVGYPTKSWEVTEEGKEYQ